MKKLFVPYDIALTLKEKGFNEQCLDFYSNENNCLFYNDKINEDNIHIGQGLAAPIYQQVVDWFREKHNIIINIDYDSKEYFYIFTFINNDDIRVLDRLSSYYNAYEKAIKEALKLI